MIFTNDRADLDISDSAYYECLDSIQDQIIGQVITSKATNIINVSDGGTGKTKTTQKFLDSLHLSALIACPKNITSQWGEYFTDPKIYVAGKTFNTDNPARIVIIGKELLSRRLSELTPAKLKKFISHFDAFVLDESHTLGKATKTFKVFKKIDTKYKILLSATPEFNTPENLYRHLTQMLGASIDYDYLLSCCTLESIVRPATKYEMAVKYNVKLHNATPKEAEILDGIFTSPRTGDLMMKTWAISGWKEGGQRALLSKAECVIQIKNKLLPYIDKYHHVELTHKQRRMYDEMLATSGTKADGGHGELVAELPITKRIRLRQICLAEPKLEWVNDFTDDVYFDSTSVSSKYDKICEILEGVDRCVIWADSKQFALLCEKHPRIKAHTGDLTAKGRRAILAWFESTPNAVLACTYASASEGLDGLQRVCNTEIIANIADGKLGITFKQAGWRLNRTGTNFTHIIRHWILARGTLEREGIRE